MRNSNILAARFQRCIRTVFFKTNHNLTICLDRSGTICAKINTFKRVRNSNWAIIKFVFLNTHACIFNRWCIIMHVNHDNTGVFVAITVRDINIEFQPDNIIGIICIRMIDTAKLLISIISCLRIDGQCEDCFTTCLTNIARCRVGNGDSCTTRFKSHV